MNELEEMNFNWKGELTSKNIEQVAALLRNLLGNKRYTFQVSRMPSFTSSGNSNRELLPSSTGDAINVFYGRSSEGEFAGFNVHDSWGVWCCLTTPDKKEKLYFSFEKNRVIITNPLPLLDDHEYWIIVVKN